LAGGFPSPTVSSQTARSLIDICAKIFDDEVRKNALKALAMVAIWGDMNSRDIERIAAVCEEALAQGGIARRHVLDTLVSVARTEFLDALAVQGITSLVARVIVSTGTAHTTHSDIRFLTDAMALLGRLTHRLRYDTQTCSEVVRAVQVIIVKTQERPLDFFLARLIAMNTLLHRILTFDDAAPEVLEEVLRILESCALYPMDAAIAVQAPLLLNGLAMSVADDHLSRVLALCTAMLAPHDLLGAPAVVSTLDRLLARNFSGDTENHANLIAWGLTLQVAQGRREWRHRADGNGSNGPGRGCLRRRRRCSARSRSF